MARTDVTPDQKQRNAEKYPHLAKGWELRRIPRPEYVPDGCKFCIRCKYIKYLGSFHGHKQMDDGKNPSCKDCLRDLPTLPTDPDVWMPGMPDPDPEVAKNYTEPRVPYGSLRNKAKTVKTVRAPRERSYRQAKASPDQLQREEPGSESAPTVTHRQVVAPSMTDEGVDALKELAQTVEQLAQAADGEIPTLHLPPPMDAPPVPVTVDAHVHVGVEPLGIVNTHLVLRKSSIESARIDGSKVELKLTSGRDMTINGEDSIHVWRWLRHDGMRIEGSRTEEEVLRSRILQYERELAAREQRIAAQARDVVAAMDLANEAVTRYNSLVEALGPVADALKAVKIDYLKLPKQVS